MIAIDANALDVLKMTACLSLHPEFLPRPAPIGAKLGLDRLEERLLVHPGHHQNLPVLMILNDRRDQTIGIVFEVLDKGGHGKSLPGGIGPVATTRAGILGGMSDLPVHVQKNRDMWNRYATDWVEAGRRSWETAEITWGIWSVKESDVHALGDLGRWKGKDAVELGCGTGYVSAWLYRLGMHPIGVDITPNQLESARNFQSEFGMEYPLIEASAETVPLPDESFDLAISEYGASIWCDPYAWIPEAARLLRPAGELVFLRNSTLSILTSPDIGASTELLVRDQRGLHRVEYDENSVEFHLPAGPMIRLLRECGFEVLDLIEIWPPDEAQETRFDYITLDWSKRWPSEEIWRARKRA